MTLTDLENGIADNTSRSKRLWIDLTSRIASISVTTNTKIMTLLIAIGALFRFVLLGNTPSPFVDELLAAIDFRSTLRTGRHYTGLPIDLLGRITPILDGRYITHFLIGDSIGDFRLTSAILGTATIYILYRICVELFGVETGLWAAASLAIMPWAIYYSRVDIPASEYVFATATCLFCVIVAVRRKSLPAALLGSLSAALTFYIYPTALVSTPLLVIATLLVLFREARSFPLRKIALVVIASILLLIPYLWDHLVSSGSKATASLNPIITSRLLWNQHFSLGKQIHLFVVNWSSFISPRFIFLSGDPNVRQSIQSMGEVGWCLSVLGIYGILVCLSRRNRADSLLLILLFVYPIADALTYQNAYSSSVVGATGQIPWACLAAVGAVSIVGSMRRHYKSIAAALVVVALAVQCVVFGLIYFGSYDTRYGYAFEPSNEYNKAIDAIKDAGLETVPIIDQSGYLRDLVFEYYSNYELRIYSWYTSCSVLPSDVARHAVSPKVFVLSETTAYAGDANCIPATSTITASISRLRAAGWHIEVLANYENSLRSRYRTSVVYATRHIVEKSLKRHVTRKFN